MTIDENWMDKTFDELRTRGAGCSKSFTDDLEKRIVKEWKKPVSQNRLTIGFALAILAVGIAGGAYAGGNLIQQWMYGPFVKEADGTIRNLDGDVVGETVWHEDGTAVTTITSENSMVVLDGTDLPAGAFSLTFEPVKENGDQALKTSKDDNHE